MDNRRIPLEKRKWLKYDSQRSGFTHFKRELVRDDGWWVYPEEKDEPPATNHYIGGEGERNRGETRSGRKDYPTAKTEIWSP